MADISRINIAGVEYNVKDATSRQGIIDLNDRIDDIVGGGVYFIGITKTEVTDGFACTTQLYKAGSDTETDADKLMGTGENGSIKQGDMIIDSHGLEFIAAPTGDSGALQWNKLGYNTYGSLAFKNNASGKTSSPSFTSTDTSEDGAHTHNVNVSSTIVGSELGSLQTGTASYSEVSTTSVLKSSITATVPSYYIVQPDIVRTTKTISAVASMPVIDVQDSGSLVDVDIPYDPEQSYQIGGSVEVPTFDISSGSSEISKSILSGSLVNHSIVLTQGTATTGTFKISGGSVANLSAVSVAPTNSGTRVGVTIASVDEDNELLTINQLHFTKNALQKLSGSTTFIKSIEDPIGSFSADVQLTGLSNTIGQGLDEDGQVKSGCVSIIKEVSIVHPVATPRTQNTEVKFYEYKYGGSSGNDPWADSGSGSGSGSSNSKAIYSGMLLFPSNSKCYIPSISANLATQMAEVRFSYDTNTTPDDYFDSGGSRQDLTSIDVYETMLSGGGFSLEVGGTNNVTFNTANNTVSVATSLPTISYQQFIPNDSITITSTGTADSNGSHKHNYDKFKEATVTVQ